MENKTWNEDVVGFSDRLMEISGDNNIVQELMDKGCTVTGADDKGNIYQKAPDGVVTIIGSCQSDVIIDKTPIDLINMENDDKNYEILLKEYNRIESDYSRVLEYVTGGILSKTNYKIDDILSIIDDCQNDFYEGIIKSDLKDLINDGGTIEDLKIYVESLHG